MLTGKSLFEILELLHTYEIDESLLLSAMLMLSLSLLEEFLSKGLTFSSWEEYWWERQIPPPGV